MNISDFKNAHYKKPAFCLGTAPHLNELNLDLLKDFVTIGCNQLAYCADKYNLDFICFQRNERFRRVRDILGETCHPNFIIPKNILIEDVNWRISKNLKDRICPVDVRFTSPKHADFFSFDLKECFYACDSVAIEIQLAAWMGCNPIYILGVDAKFLDSARQHFDDLQENEKNKKRIQNYVFPDIIEWLKNVKTLLYSKKIKLLNAAGELSSLDILPKIRLEAAVGRPKIVVTSKTFSNDQYLVKELKRYFPDARINTSKGKLEGPKLIEFLKDADGIILGTEPFNAEIMEALPCLRFVSKYGVGLNNIDFYAVKKNEIDVLYKKNTNSDSVAELTLAFVLMLIRQIDNSIEGYRNDEWKKLPGKELAEMTLGIIGYGNIGPVVAKKFIALGIKRLLVNDLIDFQNDPSVEFVPLHYLLKESDIVSMHVSMEKQNYHMINKDFINGMKRGAFLINTSRGDIVDENVILHALKNNQLAGVALDVYEHEPEINKKLLSAPNLLTTCHIAGSSNRAIKNMGWIAIEGLLNLFNMSPY